MGIIYKNHTKTNMHNIQSKKRANVSLFYGNRSGLIFSPSSERPQCSVKRGDCLNKASSSPFSETKEESRRKNAALIFSFGIFSFVSRQKKSTPQHKRLHNILNYFQ